MSQGSPGILLMVVAVAVVGAILVGAYWPNLMRQTRRNHRGYQSSPATPPPVYRANSSKDQADWLPRLGVGISAHQAQPDLERRSVTIQYVKPGADDVPSKVYESNLAGINHQSVTGEHRQTNIRTLQPGQLLVLIRNYDNPHDKHAIMAFTESGKDVGYLPAHFADRIARVLDARRAVTAAVDEVEEFVSTSGTRLLGVRIRITTYKEKRKPRTGAASSRGPKA